MFVSHNVVVLVMYFVIIDLYINKNSTRKDAINVYFNQNNRRVWSGLEIPDEIHGAPGETCAKSRKYQFITFLKLVAVLVETDRN